ncbi:MULTISPECIES: DUF4192 domain-containing protein [Nocardia]|uniref:DUF4192 domain-containing protein n=1 Tax=Nocardia TaxID=1817 RepID=UPI000BEFECC5|nr:MULTISPECIES: DUF4192 domain-containing protein [Nocardia]MBF6188901.1 DUF4192 domain-containing protein [Nocardia farcinica]MBF6294567.1 DUF4192 domain-containing protein [Nocardia farcinica]MBF6314079.1 DUF4192 domain-containing protein [Nocardia farcinica]MBF6382127.1 DUF4192 domain-containing protein [Nocardia farcinica]MBF6387991.1 DUF4192 domain-containing protein [Nocardia farcinica]
MKIPSPSSAPGRLIAEIPGLLGYYPGRGAALLFLRHPDPGSSTLATVAFCGEADASWSMPGTFERFGDSVIMVVVDDRCTSGMASGQPRGRPKSPLLELCLSSIAGQLKSVGVAIVATWVTPAIAHGSPWWDAENPDRRGLVEDPATSSSGLSRAVNGRGIYASRAAIAADLAIDDRASAAVTAALTALGRGPSGAPADASALSVEEERSSAQFALECIDAIAQGESLSPRQLARLAVALTSRHQLSMLCGVAETHRRTSAENLWMLMTRVLAGPLRAHPACLLAFSAVRRGDGSLAAIAIEIAAAANGSDVLVRLLSMAIRGGLSPRQLGGVAEAGCRTAAALGVDLGPLSPPNPDA